MEKRPATAPLIAVVVIVVVLGAVAAIAAARHHGGHDAATTTSTTLSTNVAPSFVTVSFADNGRTMRLHRGSQLDVVLSSTYWRFQTVPEHHVLSGPSHVRVTPRPSGCVPGEGCGTASARYVARSDGRTTVLATRSSCGEALGCTGSTGRFEVVVVVG